MVTNIGARPAAARRPSPPSETLDWVLAPFSSSRFFEEVFERRVGHFQRTAPEYWNSILTLRELDAILGTHEVRFPDVRLVQSGETIETDDYSVDGLIDPLAVARLHSTGATVIFSHLQNRSKAVADFVNDLSRVLSSPVQANVYLTPAHAQGFPAHWDTHDVIILQIAGSKKWRIYDGGPSLPLRGQNFDKHAATIGPVTEEFEIRAGEAAYVPRGVIHSAHSTDDASLHITVGLLNYTWADIFMEAVANAALRDERFRKSIRVDADTQAQSDWAATVAAQWEALSKAVDLPSSVRALRSDMLSRQKPHLGNLLAQVDRAHALHGGSVVKQRDGIHYEIAENNDRFQIEFLGRVIDFPSSVAAAVRTVFSQDRVRIADLPGDLQDEEKLVLVRRLVREGVVEITE